MADIDNGVIDRREFADYESPDAADFNWIQDWISAHVLEGIGRGICTIDGTAYDAVLSGYTVSFVSGYTVRVAPGWAMVYVAGDPGDRQTNWKLIRLADNEDLTFSAHEADPRIDLIQIKYQMTETDQETRDIWPPASEEPEPDTFYLHQEQNPLIEIKEGTAAGSPVAPTPDSGYYALAYINIPAVSGDPTFTQAGEDENLLRSLQKIGARSFLDYLELGPEDGERVVLRYNDDCGLRVYFLSSGDVAPTDLDNDHLFVDFEKDTTIMTYRFASSRGLTTNMTDGDKIRFYIGYTADGFCLEVDYDTGDADFDRMLRVLTSGYTELLAIDRSSAAIRLNGSSGFSVVEQLPLSGWDGDTDWAFNHSLGYWAGVYSAGNELIGHVPESFNSSDDPHKKVNNVYVRAVTLGVATGTIKLIQRDLSLSEVTLDTYNYSSGAGGQDEWAVLDAGSYTPDPDEMLYVKCEQASGSLSVTAAKVMYTVLKMPH